MKKNVLAILMLVSLSSQCLLANNDVRYINSSSHAAGYSNTPIAGAREALLNFINGNTIAHIDSSIKTDKIITDKELQGMDSIFLPLNQQLVIPMSLPTGGFFMVNGAQVADNHIVTSLTLFSPPNFSIVLNPIAIGQTTVMITYPDGTEKELLIYVIDNISSDFE